MLREPARYEGSGEYFLSFEGEGEGYVAWIRGAAEKPHAITLNLLRPLSTVGQETRLRLLIPRATESKLKLTVPYPKAVAKASEGATLQMPGGNDKETELTVVGPSGDFELSWHPLGTAADKAAALEAFGTIVAQLDGRGLESEATFSVRSYGEAFDHFQIRLPPDTELVPGNPSGYTLSMVDSGGAAAGRPRPRTVVVQLAKRTIGPVEVRLSTRRAADRAGTAATRRELAGTGRLRVSAKRPGNGARSPSAWPATGRSCGARAEASGRSISRRRPRGGRT